ncbi:MAG: hypothetical protein HY758_08850 [Nitrospirae bacterium]|nr:hypothetical protein [Nitrospirota bacterium]
MQSPTFYVTNPHGIANPQKHLIDFPYGIYLNKPAGSRLRRRIKHI